MNCLVQLYLKPDAVDAMRFGDPQQVQIPKWVHVPAADVSEWQAVSFVHSVHNQKQQFCLQPSASNLSLASLILQSACGFI